METRYNHKELEDKIYGSWQKAGYFSPEGCIKAGVTKEDAPYFSIVLPPPNVTGTLHMGHAAMLAIEDIMVRYARMNGLRTLWVPGTDHAAIATQSKVETQIYKAEGKNRHDLGREEFLKRVEQFAKESHDTIVNQVKKMGASVDWDREAFTLDEKRSLAVRTAFKNMYDDGLIYRGDRIINWDPKGQTAISDDEIVYEERESTLYTFKYSKDFPISISTTRPETKVGDTAVAVHPEDERYKAYIGKAYKAEFCGVPIEVKIIADKEVDPTFGTGALGVTPAHSQIDWEMAERHRLPIKKVIDERAKMIVGKDNILGKKTTEARAVVIEWLRSEGLLEKEERIKQNVATAERTGAVIEPLPRLQWFISVNKKFVLRHSEIAGIESGSETTLKSVMKHVVESSQIKIIPERFERVYYNWIDNLRDWCISRQIWYGHRIPAYYCKNCSTGRVMVSVKTITQCPNCASRDIEQDSDTLDTWFSSGLWTFSTLGWPFECTQGKLHDHTQCMPTPGSDLANYHPTSVIETGYDILFPWVARMILMTGYHLGTIPFSRVYLHGLVRDAQGRKMSKSLGNIIDPLTMIEKYGADATRLSLIIGTAPGNDSKISEDKIKGYRNFSTKIWNAARFVLMNYKETATPAIFTDEDNKSLEELKIIKAEVTKYIEDFDFNRAGETLYHYFWHTFADKIIEASKPRLSGVDEASRNAAQTTLITILKESLKMLHPFIPYVTEEIWAKFREIDKTINNPLIIEKW